MPRAESTVNGAQTFVCPMYFHESSFHVSLPNSPASGTVLKRHTRRPVRTSKACTSPGGSPRYWRRSPTPLPTMTRFPHTTGGDVLV